MGDISSPAERATRRVDEKNDSLNPLVFGLTRSHDGLSIYEGRRRRRVRFSLLLGVTVLQVCAVVVLPFSYADSTWQQTAKGPSYGGDTAFGGTPEGDDVWVSCNPTGASEDGCVLDQHTKIYSHDPNMRDASFYSSSNSHVGGSIEIPEWGGIGTEESPARTCADLARLPHSVSGHYFLRPSEDFPAFKGYCDLDSFGGGWLMCYTTSGEVHVSREVSSTVPFPNEGYRSDCRDYPFNQVMYVEHDIRTGATSEDKAYFNFRGRNALVASRSGYRGSVDQSWAVGLGADGILFDAKGFASTRTPECVQERANSGCRAPLVSALNKLQECPDCYSVRPQLGNATCLPAAGTDASLCWCDTAAVPFICIYIWIDGWMDGWMDVYVYMCIYIYAIKAGH